MTNNIFLGFQKNFKNKITNIKTGVRKLKENFSEAKAEPRSKRKSFALGMITIFGIFGVRFLTPVLSAVAKDLPKDTPKPGGVAPGPAPRSPFAPSDDLKKAIVSIGGTVCGLAISTGSFTVGIGCGIIVILGIFKIREGQG